MASFRMASVCPGVSLPFGASVLGDLVSCPSPLLFPFLHLMGGRSREVLVVASDISPSHFFWFWLLFPFFSSWQISVPLLASKSGERSEMLAQLESLGWLQTPSSNMLSSSVPAQPCSQTPTSGVRDCVLQLASVRVSFDAVAFHPRGNCGSCWC